jgi:small subunit ribosomal protein S6
MFLLDSNRYGRDPEGVSGQIPAMIQAAGGELLVSRLWEERRLAYSIRGRRKGTYWLTYFRLNGRQIADLRRQAQLNDAILRVLFVKIDPRIVETVVEHAQAGSVKPAAERTAGKPAAPAKAEAKPPQKEAAAEEGPAAAKAESEPSQTKSNG